MTDRLDAELRLLAADVTFPPTPPLAPAVATRLADGPGASRPVRRPWARALALGIGLSLLAAATVLALGWVLPGLRIVPVASVPPAASVQPGGDLRLGSPMAVPDAPFVVESAGTPSTVYVAAQGNVTSLVFAARNGLPEIEGTGIGLLIQRIEGDLETAMIEKLVDEVGASVIPVSVGDAPGFWITGPPHLVRYLTPAGAVRSEMTRLVGDTLVWQADGVVYRMESRLELDGSLQLAASVRER
jgi:hypothetical protein